MKFADSYVSEQLIRYVVLLKQNRSRKCFSSVEFFVEGKVNFYFIDVFFTEKTWGRKSGIDILHFMVENKYQAQVKKIKKTKNKFTCLLGKKRERF